MVKILHTSVCNISSLRTFYKSQKKYIDRVSRKEMKEHSLGFLAYQYYNAKREETDDEARDTFRRMGEVIEAHYELIELSEERIVYRPKSIVSKKNANITKAAIEYSKYADMPYIHMNNTLVMLITRFEEFIADYIENLYKKYPEKYINGQTVTYSDIKDMSLENIGQAIIDREVEKIMRDSYTKWFKLFDEHKIGLGYCANEMDLLSEIYAIRNVIIHNSGIVNDSFLKNVKSTKYRLGDAIEIDDGYIEKSFQNIITIIFCLTIEGMKTENDDLQGKLNFIFNMAFDELCSENYLTCKIVFYVLSQNQYSDDELRQMSKVNYWISRIHIEGLESVKEEIEKYDVSALDEKFMLAKSVLLKEYKDVNAELEYLISQNRFSPSLIEEWPLFYDYIHTTEYKSLKEAHPEYSDTLAVENNPNVKIKKQIPESCDNEDDNKATEI